MAYSDQEITNYAYQLKAKGAPDSDIETFISKAKQEQKADASFNQPAQTPGYFSRVGSDIAKGVTDSYNAGVNSFTQPKAGVTPDPNNPFSTGIDPLSTGLQVAAPLVKAAASPLVEAGTSALNFADSLGDHTVSNLFKQWGNTEMGQRAQTGVMQLVQKWNEFKDTHPTLANDAKSVFDIATNLPVVAAEGKIVGGIAKGLTASADQQANAELVQSIADAKGKNIETGKEVVKKGFGPFAKDVVPPSERDVAAAQEFSDQLVKGDPAKSAANITDHIGQVSEESIKPFLQEHNKIFNQNTLRSYLEKAAEDQPINFTANDGDKVYEKVIDTMMKKVADNPQNMEGLWDARKEFDQAVLKQFPNAYNGASTATKQALQNIRQAANQYIIEGTGGVEDNAFAQGMEHLSNAFNIRDNLLEKAVAGMNKSAASKFLASHGALIKAAELIGAGTLVGGGISKAVKAVGQ